MADAATGQGEVQAANKDKMQLDFSNQFQDSDTLAKNLNEAKKSQEQKKDKKKYNGVIA